MTRTDIIPEHPCCGLDPFLFFADRGPDHADTSYNLHWDVFDIKPRRVFGVAIMQLADAFHRNTLVLECMTPSLGRACIRHCIVPKPRFVDRLACRKRRTCRNANGGGRIGICKPYPARCECIKVWGFHKRMPRTAQGAGLMFVGHDYKKIGLCHFVMSFGASRVMRASAATSSFSSTRWNVSSSSLVSVSFNRDCLFCETGRVR